MTGRGRTGRGGAETGGPGRRGYVLRPGDRGVPSSWGSGDSEPPRVKVNLPVLTEFSGPLHAVWSEDRRPRTRVRSRGRWGWGTRVGEPGTRDPTTITPCACPRTRDSHPGTRVEKVPRALEFRTHWAPLWVLLPAPFSVTKPVAGYLAAPPIPHNNSWRPWRQRLLNFSRRGGPGTPFPWHQNTRVTARRSPEPLALVGHQCILAVPLQTRRGFQAAGIKLPRDLNPPRCPPSLNM